LQTRGQKRRCLQSPRLSFTSRFTKHPCKKKYGPHMLVHRAWPCSSEEWISWNNSMNGIFIHLHHINWCSQDLSVETLRLMEEILHRTSWYGKYPIVYRVLYIPGGAGFLLKVGMSLSPTVSGTLKGQDFMTFAAIKVLQAPFHRQQPRSLGHAGFTCHGSYPPWHLLRHQWLVTFPWLVDRVSRIQWLVI